MAAVLIEEGGAGGMAGTAAPGPPCSSRAPAAGTCHLGWHPAVRFTAFDGNGPRPPSAVPNPSSTPERLEVTLQELEAAPGAVSPPASSSQAPPAAPLSAAARALLFTQAA